MGKVASSGPLNSMGLIVSEPFPTEDRLGLFLESMYFDRELMSVVLQNGAFSNFLKTRAAITQLIAFVQEVKPISICVDFTDLKA